MHVTSIKYVCYSLLLSGALLATPVAQTTDTTNSQADNTKVNKRDRSKTEPTADNASNGTNDRELMRQIRRDVVSDKSLSTYGHNVKIVAEHGKVTLKGVVHSEQEKKTIEDLARKHAGDNNVSDEITVKGDSANK